MNQTVEQEFAHALADRLEERAERYATAARSADRRVGGQPYHGTDWPWIRALGLSDYYTSRAVRLRIAARVVREEEAR